MSSQHFNAINVLNNQLNKRAIKSSDTAALIQSKSTVVMCVCVLVTRNKG